LRNGVQKDDQKGASAVGGNCEQQTSTVNSWYMAIGRKNMAPSKTQNTSLLGQGQSAWYLQNLIKARV